MPRVSEIIDFFQEPYLVQWKLKTKDWQKVSQESIKIGTAVDSLVQDYINGEKFDVKQAKQIEGLNVDEQVKVFRCIEAFNKFELERPDVMERLRKYKANMQRELVLGDLVGHPDFILDDEVIDLKTSKQVSKSHWMQTAQYYHMANQQPQGVGCDDICWARAKISILRLDKLTGEYEYKTLEQPFVEFWQRKFQARYEAFCEDKEFAEMMRVKLEEEKL